MWTPTKTLLIKTFVYLFKSYESISSNDKIPTSTNAYLIYDDYELIVTFANTARCLIKPTFAPSGVSIGQKYP